MNMLLVSLPLASVADMEKLLAARMRIGVWGLERMRVATSVSMTWTSPLAMRPPRTI